MTTATSIDVFDTVLTRLCGSPRQVFVLTGRQLRADRVITIDPLSYAASREQVLADLTPDPARHPDLEQVATELASRLGLAPDAARDLLAAELAVESQVCRAVPGAVERLEAQRRRDGRGVVFVSDSPSPAEFLESLLRREGLFHDGDRLFVSSTEGFSKQQGDLFAHVAGELELSPSSISHTGDDRHSDVAHARMHGWRATLDRAGPLTSRELELDRHSDATGGMAGRLAGAARMTRLKAAADGLDPGTASIAGAVALPLLAGFGLWLLRQAAIQRLDRLYFVARDGEVFLEVARYLAEHTDDEVECRYLHGSRRAWQLAAAGTAARPKDEGLWVPDDVAGADLKLADALALVDLDLATATTLSDDDLLSRASSDSPLGEQGWSRLQALLRHGPLADESSRRLRARRDVLVRYLDQQEVTSPGRVGLVDVGWTGRATTALEEVLIDAQRPLPAAYLFLGLLAPASELMGADLHRRSTGWLVDETRGRPSLSGHYDPVMIIESFAMGSEGNTLGFEERPDGVVATLRSERNEATRVWDYAGYRISLKTALEALCDGPVLDTAVDLRRLAWRQLMAFWRHPSRAEALAWGAQPYGEDFANAELHPLARAVTAKRLLARLRLGPSTWREPTYWLPGTLRLSPPVYRWMLSAAQRAGIWPGLIRRVGPRVRLEINLRRDR